MSYRGRVEEYIRDIAIRPDGEVVAGHTARGIHFCRLSDGTVVPRKTYRTWGGSLTRALAWSGDGERIALAQADSTGRTTILHQFLFAESKLLAHHDPDAGSIDAIAFSPDDQRLAWRSAEKIGIWDPDGDRSRDVKHDQEAMELAFVRRRGGQPTVLTMTGRGTFQYRDAETLEPFEEVDPDTDDLFLALVANASHAVYGSYRGVSLRNVRTGEETAALERGDSRDIRCAFGDRHLRWLALGTEDGRILVWEPGDDRLVADVRVANEPVSELAGTEDGRIVCVVGFDRSVAEVLHVGAMMNT
jgi:WD40 repeat protein